MSVKKPLLFEIGLEELPIKAVKNLSMQLKDQLTLQLSDARLDFDVIKTFSTPRRLAVLVEGLEPKQADYTIEKKGPAVKNAFDESGNPTKALEGFMRSNQITLTKLGKKQFGKAEFMIFKQEVPGKTVIELLPNILESTLKKISIAKPMRWSDLEYEFVRPVHWLVLLYAEELIDAEFFGKKAGRSTFGHRYHANFAIEIKHANNYEDLLKQDGKVIANFEERKKLIHDKSQQLAKSENAIAILDSELLDAVTGLVEYPVPMVVEFDEAFLKLPEEALISAMQTHQKVFHLINKQGELLPKFIAVANIDSAHKERVQQGNARVMRARLADAEFFYETDCKIPLEEQAQKLQKIVFHEKLGTLFDRSKRISRLAEWIATELKINCNKAKQAGWLAKADLVSNMVEEFPELQGTMGYHYANFQGLDEDIAMGLRGQYMPRFSGDSLPRSLYGCVVSMADRVDKLIGIFGINQIPSGEKDPFALRRAAIGLLTIVIEKKLPLHLKSLLLFAAESYDVKLENSTVVENVYQFILERLKNWYQGKSISVEIFNAVAALGIDELSDFSERIAAVKTFSEQEEAKALAAANKRVKNLLSKEKISEAELSVEVDLFNNPAETMLFEKIKAKNELIQPLLKRKDYTDILLSLADLQPAIDEFFDSVMVMAEDEKIKNNRLALLCQLKNLFLTVADVAKL